MNPNLETYAQRNFKIYQNYHIEFKNNRCIIYISGEKNYSELLLERGLGIIMPNFQDKEFSYMFKNAQKRAKKVRRGVYKNNIFINCKASLYTENY